MFRRLALFSCAALLAAFAFATAPASAQYQPTQSQVLSASTVRPGDTITVSGTGCPSGSAVSTSFDGTSVGSTTASSSGAFSLSITIPSSASAGTHTITSTCGSVVLTSTVTVLGASVTTPAPSTGSNGVNNGTLARTGIPTARYLQLGIGLTAAGGAALALSRSRRLRTA